jgi:two-component system response regulator FixJ
MNGKRIVFVDDEPGVFSVVSRTLERAGLDVRCFQSARDCLAHLAQTCCDLLVTDVRMPDMDGMTLLREARQQMPWLPVLLVTGYGDVPTAVLAMKTGAIDFIQKPFERDAFVCAVQSVLAKNVGLATLRSHALTRTEMKILYLILEGKNNREIAAVSHRSPRTIEVHRGHIMQKLGVNNIIELLRRTSDMGLVQPNSPDAAGCLPQ